MGRWSPERSRERLLTGFHPEFTRIVWADAAPVGSIAVRPTPHEVWIEHFYLEPALQGRGLGTAILTHVLGEPTGGLPFRIDVLQGSAARRLYERHGFGFERDDEIDVYLVRAGNAGPEASADPGP